ncbi:MAG: hypothetical protein QQN41_05670 [Nitrosopumilus sp.]
MNTNQYKIFRDVKRAVEGNLLTKRYDEPTYLTFRVIFGEDFASWSGVTLLNTNYDKMPHPLFNPMEVDATKDEKSNIIEFNRDYYSTIDYLRDSNEFSRAEMLKEFQNMWNDLQRNFQYYFRSVEGVGDLLKPAPGRGRRVASDFRLTFNMAEGIDQRVSYLLNLYRKIAWDDDYQRWVLPDMMRYFSIKIYITEFRTFHRSSLAEHEEPTANQQQNVYNYGAGRRIIDRLKEELGFEQIKRAIGIGKSALGIMEPAYLRVLNGILPTHVIECQMCEFDIENFNLDYKNTLSVYDAPTEATVSFKCKVGNINEVQTYPLFNHYIFNDKRINSSDRSKEKGLVKDVDGRIKNAFIGGLLGGTLSIPSYEKYVTTKQGDARYKNMDEVAQDTVSQKHVHEAGGVPFFQSTGYMTSPDDLIKSRNINSTDPATWVENALTFGKAFGINFIAERADKLKMTNIPGLGFSFNEAIAAIESKSFISVLALIRKAITKSIGGTEPPSGKLDERINNTFREFLTGVTQSEATDDDELELIKASNLALSSKGTWEKIKDLSLATDLIGPGEVNIPVKIEGRDNYKQAIALSTNNDRSLATDLDGGPIFFETGKIFESAPSKTKK